MYVSYMNDRNLTSTLYQTVEGLLYLKLSPTLYDHTPDYISKSCLTLFSINWWIKIARVGRNNRLPKNMIDYGVVDGDRHYLNTVNTHNKTSFSTSQISNAYTCTEVCSELKRSVQIMLIEHALYRWTILSGMSQFSKTNEKHAFCIEAKNSYAHGDGDHIHC